VTWILNAIVNTAAVVGALVLLFFFLGRRE
jgi:hypothetical protein